jgi:hypothetical protein
MSQNEANSVKTPVVQRHDYVMYLEFFAGMHWFHTDVFNWTPTVKKKYLEDLNLLQYLVGTPLVALVEKDNTKLAKFGQSIGFKCLEPCKGKDDEQYYIWSRGL